MKSSDLTFRTAQKQVENYREEKQGLMAQHHEAMECFDCQAFLQLGIDSYKWLLRATRGVRLAIIRGDDPQAAESEATLRRLRRAWLEACDLAEEWSAAQKQRGFKVDNLEEFRGCCEKMRQQVEYDVQPGPSAGSLTVQQLEAIAVPPPREWLDEPSWTP